MIKDKLKKANRAKQETIVKTKMGLDYRTSTQLVINSGTYNHSYSKDYLHQWTLLHNSLYINPPGFIRSISQVPELIYD